MQPARDAVVYVVDDDAGVRDALGWLLRSRRLPSRAFEAATQFVSFLEEASGHGHPCCLLLDVRMPGMSGLELFDRLAGAGLLATMPVIFLSGHADVPTAVDAVKRGAFDFCEKPFSDNALVDRVVQALESSAAALEVERALRERSAQLGELTEREREVMRLVIEGLPNKLVADQLAISVRTVEVHRARVFEKMGVKSAVELANLLRNQ